MGRLERREVIGDATLPVPDLSRPAADVCVSRERAHEYLRCRQAVTGAPYRVECPVFVREPGADDLWRDVRLRGSVADGIRSFRPRRTRYTRLGEGPS